MRQRNELILELEKIILVLCELSTACSKNEILQKNIFIKKQFLNAEAISDKSISIPLTTPKTKDLNHIVNTLKKILT